MFQSKPTVDNEIQNFILKIKAEKFYEKNNSLYRLLLRHRTSVPCGVAQYYSE
jgi:hypothetical protein